MGTPTERQKFNCRYRILMVLYRMEVEMCPRTLEDESLRNQESKEMRFQAEITEVKV